MSQTAHTPGHYTISHAFLETQIKDERGILLATIPLVSGSGGETIGSDEHAANAFLFANAPDLLAALERIADQLERVGDSRKDAPFIEEARTAINKAKGVL